MPKVPLVAVGAIVRDGRDLLLVLRSHEPAKGTWSLPGGKVQWGESLHDALRREVLEETGLRVEPLTFAGIVERITRGDDTQIDHHFVVVDFWARVAKRDVPTAGDDASDARWVPIDEVPSLTLTPGLLEFLNGHGVLDRVAPIPS